MTSALLQDGLVTIIALGALSLIVRRIVALGRPTPTRNGCGSCGSTRQCAPTGRGSAGAEPQHISVQLHRK
jgi:hypothetical protein